MSVQQIKPGYLNPLTMPLKKPYNLKAGQSEKPNDKTEQIQELQTKQQQLQNEMLLLKSNGSASGDISARRQEEIEHRLEELSQELRAAKADNGLSAEDMTLSEKNASKAENTAPSEKNAGKAENTAPSEKNAGKAKKESLLSVAVSSRRNPDRDYYEKEMPFYPGISPLSSRAKDISR